MEIYKLTFKDIMSEEVLFYDPNQEDYCKKISQGWNINFLPDPDQRHFHVWGEHKKKFTDKRKIDSDRVLLEGSYIFKQQNLDIFKAEEKNSKELHDVAFVFKSWDGKIDNDNFPTDPISGIVHICDYNHKAVLIALYKDLLVFENNVRRYLFDLIGRDKKEADRISIEQDVGPEGINKEQVKILGPFQTTYLFKLIKYCVKFKGKELGFLEEPLKSINGLRKRVAHFKDPVTQQNLELSEKSSNIYNFDSLEIFFHHIHIFEKAYLTLENRIKLKDFISPEK
ncbi:MAG: hypothetical protein AAFY71_27820 [Bacteroidota bacterium]